MVIDLCRVSLYARVVVLIGAGAVLIAAGTLSATSWDFHVHTAVDDWNHDNAEKTSDENRYSDLCDKEDSGKELSKSEAREKESYEVDNIQ